MGQCWYNFILYSLFASSMIIVTVALLLCGLACWMLSDRNTFLVSFAQEQQSYEVALYLMLGLGIIMALVGILASCGACKKSRCNLMTSFCMMLICIVWQISFGVWLTINSDQLKELLKVNMINTIKNEYGEIESRTQIVDAFQYELECCGATGPTDWAGSKYSNKGPPVPLNLTVTSTVIMMYNVPESCCKMSDIDMCNDVRQSLKLGGFVGDDIHREGCLDKLLIELSKQTYIIGIISIGIGLLEFLFICISIIYMQMLVSGRYKA